MTMLLTDIEGSTTLVHRLGDHYGELLERAEPSYASNLASNGYVVEARADEFFAVFELPGRALSTALTVQHQRGHRPVTRTCASGWGSTAAIPDWPRRTTSGWRCTPQRICTASHGGQIVVSGDFRTAVGVPLPVACACGSSGRPRCAACRTRWSCTRSWPRGSQPRRSGSRSSGRERPLELDADLRPDLVEHSGDDQRLVQGHDRALEPTSGKAGVDLHHLGGGLRLRSRPRSARCRWCRQRRAIGVMHGRRHVDPSLRARDATTARQRRAIAALTTPSRSPGWWRIAARTSSTAVEPTTPSATTRWEPRARACRAAPCTRRGRASRRRRAKGEEPVVGIHRDPEPEVGLDHERLPDPPFAEEVDEDPVGGQEPVHIASMRNTPLARAA